MAENWNDSLSARIENFLNDGSRKTLLLKGAWGAGKTFYWKQFLEGYQKNYPGRLNSNRKRSVWLPWGKSETDMPAQKYAYVSLFGVRSISELRGRIVDNAGGMKKWLNRVFRLAGSGSASAYGVNISFPAEAPAWLADSVLKDFIVCFDDIERKHPGLKLEEVLGFIDSLKSERNCHCIVILNEGGLEDGDEKTLQRYRDKVIDLEVKFEPPLDRNLNVVFGDDLSGKTRSIVKDVLHKLESRNIRSILRIRWALEEFSELLASVDDAVSSRLIRQIACLVLFRYDYGTTFDITDFQLPSWIAFEIGTRMYKSSDEKTVNHTKSMSFHELLAKAEFEAHELDPVIWKYISDGNISDATSQDMLSRWRENLKRQEMAVELLNLKESAWACFGVTQGEFLQQATDFLNDYLLELKPEELIELVSFMTKVESRFNRNELIGRYISAHIEGADIKTLSIFEGWDIDSSFRTAIAYRRNQALKALPLKTVVEKLVGDDSWSPNDFCYLKVHSETELFDYFASGIALQGVREIAILAERLKSSTSGCELDVAKKLKNILEELSGRSNLNKIRCKRALVTVEAYLEEVQKAF